MSDVWDLVHQERESLVADLETVETSRWDEPSLCPGWSVHDVVAHLVDNARTSTPRLLLAMARAGFDFDRQNAQGVARERGSSPGETLERLRAVAGRTSSPPAPRASRLVEEVVHGEDVRSPLGIGHAYAQEAVVLALRDQLRTPVGFGGGKDRVEGLSLRATDAGIVVGEGPVVEGRALPLLMAVSGRRVFLGDLHGAGVDTMVSRA
ncbi:maleylpyruvate isomerase family mycothiol-dependent enzyme [uncultured Serinicoccus sp.]|uniref:maleylpyruvate isomerase family mycothiol-dependent enzyme n=1 Tax=uncultured Serinicoccus sp. TaxID=735514 RepID=UPI00260A7D0F|nr:maleylpyruvate isomerase family mycothiol-dependent enzyme [uncultured Serinicoccus sp.]